MHVWAEFFAPAGLWHFECFETESFWEAVAHLILICFKVLFHCPLLLETKGLLQHISISKT